MALPAAAATFNAAMDTLITAWNTYQATLSAGDRVYITFAAENLGGTTAVFETTTLRKKRHLKIYQGKKFYALGATGPRMLFKLTNEAGDLT